MQPSRARLEVQGSADIKLFFTCVDPNSKSKAVMWFEGVKYGVRRATSQRAMKDGDDGDQSATPVHLDLLKQIVAAYAAAGTADAARRIFGLMGLCVSSGRSSEPKRTPVESLVWCSHFTALFARVPQYKVYKTKLVAWAASASPDCCIFSAFWGRPRA